MSKEVFIAYAHQDKKLCKQLKKHLAPLEREGLIRTFEMDDIKGGADWANEIDANLNQAEVILLLISPDFLASDYCYNEMIRAIERYRAQKAWVIPIILRPSHWEASPISTLQVLPPGGRPVVDGDKRNMDKAFNSIAKRIGEPIQVKPIPNVSGKPGTPKKRLSLWKTISLGTLIVLILTGSVVAFQILRGFPFLAKGAKTATTITQTCPRGTAIPPGTSNYDMAVTKSGMQFGFDAQHSRTNPYESILNPDNVGKLQKKWDYLIGNGIDTSPPAVANGLVYVGANNGKLYAFDADTGHVQWCASTGGAINSAPAVAKGLVYVGSQDGYFYAFDAITGQKRGIAKVGSSTSSSPTIANDLIYIGFDSGNLYAFDTPIAGQLNWVPKWVAYTNPSSPTGQRGIASSPAVVGSMVYVSCRDGRLYAFDTAMAGQSNWVPKWVASTKGLLDSSPAVANGLVYVGSQDKADGWLYAFDATTGHLKWSKPTGAIHDSSPAVANNLVYIGSFTNRSLYAFNATTGQQEWIASTGDAIYSSPTVANGLVYVGSVDGWLYAFDATTGHEKGEVPASSDPKNQGIDSSPAVADGVVYIGSQDGRLYAFSLP